MIAWLSLVGAVLAFGIASLLQAHGADASCGDSEPVLGGRLLLRLARNRPYVLGTLLDVVGVLLTGRALLSLPLFLVQAATSASLCLTAVGSALLWRHGRHGLNRRIWGPVLLVTVGLTLLGSAARAGSSTGLGTAGLVALGAGAPLVLLVASLVERRSVPRPGVALAVLAGLSYAGVGVSLRALQAGPSVPSLLTEPAAIIATAYMACAFLLFARALQRLSVTQVMAIVVSIDTIVPAGVGLWLLGDGIRVGWEGAAGVGLLVTIVAVLRVIRLSAHMVRRPADTYQWPRADEQPPIGHRAQPARPWEPDSPEQDATLGRARLSP